MATTTYALVDGQILKLYSADNTYLGNIYTNATGQLVLSSAGGSDIYLGESASGANLIFDGNGVIKTLSDNAITLGESGDTVNLNVSGVAYNINLTSDSLFVLPVHSSTPAGSYQGQVIFNSTDLTSYIYNGSSWNNYSGYSGRSGVSGYSGANPGASGYSGYSGVSGYSGDNPGSSGYSGYSGVSGYSFTPSSVFASNGQTTIGISAAQLSNVAATKGVIIKALASNVGKIYVGGSGVTTSDGLELLAGESVSLLLNNLNEVYCISDTAAQVVSWAVI